MRILFYYKETESFGIEYLSSILKSKGHETNLIFDFGSSTKFGMIKSNLFNKADRSKSLIELAKKFSPDIIAFSCETDLWQDTKRMACLLKKEFDVPFIIGGRHATNLPEYVIKENCFDILCRGEGEEAMLELVEALEKKKDITKIKNLWVKKNRVVYKNEVRPLIQNLDKLPLPDRDLFYKYGAFKGQLMIMASRGCPFDCSYCNNSFYRKLYKNKGQYVRRRSVDNVISELKYFIKRYKIKSIHIEDENFTVDIDWLRNFIRRYKAEVDLPFWCQANPNNLNEEKIKLLKEAGCKNIFMGVESGNKKIREGIYHRFVSEDQIRKIASLVKKYKMSLQCTAIFGAPEEGPKEMWDTVNFIQEIRPNAIPTYTLYPYPNTAIFNYCKEKNYLNENTLYKIYNGLEGSHGRSILNHPYANMAYNISKMLSFYVRSPKPLKYFLKKFMDNKYRTSVNYFYLIFVPFDYPFLSIEKMKAFLRGIFRKPKL